MGFPTSCLFRFSQSQQDQADLNDFDADPTTDRFVVIIWVDFSAH